MLFAGEVKKKKKRCPQPPVSIQSTSPLHIVAVITPLISSLNLCVFVCSFCLFSFAKPGILSLYGFDSGLHLSGFLRFVFLYLLIISFAPRLCGWNGYLCTGVSWVIVIHSACATCYSVKLIFLKKMKWALGSNFSIFLSHKAATRQIILI